MDKKGVSEIVSYTILIAIAITLAVFVFAYLKLYVPKDKPECKEGINLAIEDAKCIIVPSPGTSTIKIILQNRGLFKVDFAYLRIGKTEDFKVPIKTDPIPLIPQGGASDVFNPSESTPVMTFSLPSTVDTVGDYILEVQPVLKPKEDSSNPDTWALCPSITQKITCS